MNLKERWRNLFRALQLEGDPDLWFARLADQYRRPRRHYHTLGHIHYGLMEFDRVRDAAREPNLLEFAWWFHDAVYDPMRHDNEEQSAALATTLLPSDQVWSLILTTVHKQTPTDPDARLLVDIDLSIFGASEQIYDRYERNIRKEYAFVPEETFRTVRANILERFLGREHIYETQLFRDRLDARARINLARAIRTLRGL